MNRYVLFYNDRSEITQPFSIWSWIGFMIRKSAIISEEGKRPTSTLGVLLAWIEAQEIGHHFAYEQVECTWQSTDGQPKRYERTVVFLCVPDDNAAVLLRLRFDCLPIPRDQDLRAPWFPRPAYATVKLDD